MSDLSEMIFSVAKANADVARTAYDAGKQQLDQTKLERDQAVAALRLIMEAGHDLFKLIDALHAARSLLTRM